MKNIISCLVMVCLLITSICVMTGCDESKNSTKTGLRYTKYSGNEYYTVIGFVLDKNDDGTYKDLENGVLDIQKVVGEDKVVGEISKEAFKGVKEVKELIIPTTVETIGEGAFAEMPDLAKLTVPFIGKNANTDSIILGTAGGENKAVDLERTMFYWFGTEEYDGGASVTSKYNATATETTYYLPVGLEYLYINAKKNSEGVADYEIPAYACYGNKILKALEINNVVKLGDYSFAECTKLATINEYAKLNEAFVGSHALENSKVEIGTQGTGLFPSI